MNGDAYRRFVELTAQRLIRQLDALGETFCGDCATYRPGFTRDVIHCGGRLTHNDPVTKQTGAPAVTDHAWNAVYDDAYPDLMHLINSGTDPWAMGMQDALHLAVQLAEGVSGFMTRHQNCTAPCDRTCPAAWPSPAHQAGPRDDITFLRLYAGNMTVLAETLPE